MHSNGFGGKGATPPEETDTKVRKLLQVGGREAVQSKQGRKKSHVKGWDEVEKNEQNYTEKGRCTGKMEGDDTGVFRSECPSCLHGQRIV